MKGCCPGSRPRSRVVSGFHGGGGGVIDMGGVSQPPDQFERGDRASVRMGQGPGVRPFKLPSRGNRGVRHPNRRCCTSSYPVLVNIEAFRYWAGMMFPRSCLIRLTGTCLSSEGVPHVEHVHPTSGKLYVTRLHQNWILHQSKVI